MVASFKQKNNHDARKKIFMHLGGLLIIALFVVLVIANVKMYQKRQEFLVQAASLKQQIAALQDSNHNLQEGISNENNPGYIEKVAREELDLQCAEFEESARQEHEPRPHRQTD